MLGCSGSDEPSSAPSPAPASPAAGAAAPEPALEPATILGAMTAAEKEEAYAADVDAVQSRVTRLQAMLGRLPASLTDIKALAASLPTPQAAFEFVRDQIALEPYPGNLKTPLAALVTRGGNTLDRALLLAEILRAHGIAVRIAHGRLSPERARQLLQQIATRPEGAARMLDSVGGGWQSPELSPHQRDRGEMAVSRNKAAGAAVVDAVSRTSASLATAVPAARAAALSAATTRQLQALAEHFWVKASINNATVDLDPSDAAAVFGQALATVSKAFDPSGIEPALFQRIRFRLVGDFVEGDNVQSVELLARDYRAADLFGKHIRLGVGPASLSEDEARCDAFLMVGGERTNSQPFRLSGTDDAVGGGFGGALGGDEPATRALGRLSVEITSSGPLLEALTYRRVILDRLDGTGRRLEPALADDKTIRSLVMQVWDAAASVGPNSLPFVLGVQLQAIKARAPMELKALGHLYRGEPFGVGDLAPPVLPPELVNFFLSSDLTRFFLQRDRAPQVRSYYERPRLAFMRRGFQVADWSSPAGPRRFVEGIDLVNSPFQWVGRADDIQPAGIAAGVADTALEAQFARGEVFNTLPLAAAAEGQRIPMETIAAGESARLAALSLPGAIRRVLEEELAEGRTIVAPTRLVTLHGVQAFGWWSLDPRTGIAIGRMDLGGAQGLVEVGKMHERIAKWTEILAKFYSGVLKCYINALADNLGAEDALKQLQLPVGPRGQDPSPSTAKLAECIIKTACGTIADLLAEAIMTPAFAKEADEFVKPLQKIIFEWAAETAMNDAAKRGFNAACESKK
jgi:hypothetical protein